MRAGMYLAVGAMRGFMAHLEDGTLALTLTDVCVKKIT